MTSANRKRALELLAAGMSADGVAALLSLPLESCVELAAPAAPGGTWAPKAGQCDWCGSPLTGAARAARHEICAIAAASPSVWPLALIEAVGVGDVVRAAELYRARTRALTGELAA